MIPHHPPEQQYEDDLDKRKWRENMEKIIKPANLGEKPRRYDVSTGV